MKALEDGTGRSLLTQDEVKDLAKKAGLVPAKMTGSSMRKMVKEDKIGKTFESDSWEDFFKHLADKNCAIFLQPGSSGYMRIQSTKEKKPKSAPAKK